MNDHDRLEQLRGMLDRLGRMPASDSRDWMLREVRARAVDVETGVRPAPMRPLQADEAEPQTTRDPAPAAATPAPVAIRTRRAKARPRVEARSASRPQPERVVPRPAPVAAREPAAREAGVDLLEQGGLLCLDEPAAPPSGSSRSWLSGLRG